MTSDTVMSAGESGWSGRLIYDSVVYGASRYLGALTGIVLTPIYTRILTKEDYGVIDMFVTWNTFMAMVIPLGLPMALQRYYAEVRDDPERRHETIGTLQGLLLGAAILYGLVLLPFCHVFLAAFNVRAAPPEVFYLSLALVMLTSYFAFVQSLHQAAFRKYRFVALSVLNFAVMAMLGFFLVYVLRQGIVGFFRASIIALALSCLAGLLTTRDALALAVKPSLARQALSYSLPFVGVFLLFQSSNVLDRLLITWFLSLEAVGVFSVAGKVAGLLSLAISSFWLAWFPYAMRIKETAGARQLYARMFSYYVAVACVLVSGIAMFRAEIIHLAAPTYGEAYGTIAILCLCYVVVGSVYVLTLGLHIVEQTRHIVAAGLVSVAVNAIVSVVLVRAMGLEGIAYGTLVGSLVWVVLQVRKAQSLYRIPFTYELCVKAAVVTVIVIYSGPYVDAVLQPVPVVTRIGAKVVVLGVTLAVAYLGAGTNLPWGRSGSPAASRMQVR